MIVPPLLRKPITEDPTIRAIWGLAQKKLEEATHVVMIGLSAAPTDFYASWLLRSSVGLRDGVEVYVVNPENNPHAGTNAGFRARMQSIFPRGYHEKFETISQLGDLWARIRPPVASAPAD